ncbi:MAG: rod shape-determining protein MreC [Oscillospiraceae bacterium]|nr:rod shape-determining protein MreC [Oscillospiraceae bacterium]
MKRFFRNNGAVLLIAALILSVLIGVGGRMLGTDPLTGVINTVSTPVRAGINAVINWAEGLYDYMFHYQDMEQEVSELRRKVARLEDQVRQGQEASRENKQLRQLLNLQEKRRDFVFEAARVSARGTQGWDSTLTISKGSASGVKISDCVITETGALVGVVSQVGPNWATVDTVISPNMEMGALVSRANASGILEGELSMMQQGLVKLSYLPLDTGLLPGDEVLTSGRGEVYPSGLVVGTVEQLKTDQSGMNCYALVHPAVELDQLIEVFVIKQFHITD